MGMAQALPLHGAGHPIALVRPLSTGAGLQGDGAGPEVSWRRSVFIDGTCAANVASVLSNGAGPHHFFGPAPGCLGTCAGQLGDLRRTGEGAFGCRGCLTLRPSALFSRRPSVLCSSAALCSVLSASLRSALLCCPLLCSLGAHQRCGTQARVAMLTRTSEPNASKRAFAQADRVEPVV